jgi:hypothetical protein
MTPARAEKGARVLISRIAGRAFRQGIEVICAAVLLPVGYFGALYRDFRDFLTSSLARRTMVCLASGLDNRFCVSM